MTLETEVTPQLPEIGAAPPAESAEPAAPAAEPTTEPESAESPEAPPRTWESVRAEIEADESVKSDYEAWVAERTEEGKKEGRKAVQDRVESTLRIQRQTADAAYRGVEDIKAGIIRGLRDGSITEQGLAEAFSTNQGALMAYNALRGIDQSSAGVKGMISLMAGDDRQMVDKYHARVDDFYQGYESDTAIVTDLIDDLTNERIAKAKKPLQTKINALEAEVEKLKATGRDGKGPSDAAPKVAVGDIRTLAEAERRYALPAGHPERLDNEQFKATLQTLGITKY